MRPIGLLAMLPLLTHCSSDPQSSPSLASPVSAATVAPTATATLETETPPPNTQAIHNDHLQKLMIQMNHLVSEQMRENLALPKDQRQRLGELAATAGQLTGTVDAIIATLPGLNLNPDDQATFMALANRLHHQARRMETDAQKSRWEAIPSNLEQLTLTCSACHSLFRKNQGILERCRDPRHTC